MISLPESWKDVWKLLTGGARQEAEAANEAAYRELDRKMCAAGIDGLDDIDRLMHGGRRAGHRRDGGRSNGHDKPASR
jgi:hypothetical protein